MKKNVVIPMAGAGSRFVKAGYAKPKPFIDVNGKPMISRVIENLYSDDTTFFLIARQEHLNAEKELVKHIESTYNAVFIPIDKLTEGAACTVLYARKYINNDSPLLIANSDQIVDFSVAKFMDDCFDRRLDGSILTFVDSEMNPKWSFAKIDEKTGYVTEVREKIAISQFATVGIYFFAQGRLFVDNAIDMIIENDRINNEYYVCPVYNYLIKNSGKIGHFLINSTAMHGIGTPDDLQKYLQYIKRP